MKNRRARSFTSKCFVSATFRIAAQQSTFIVYWKVEDSKKYPDDLDESDTGNKARRRILLRYYRVWNLEQCELPQAVLDKLPKIETHAHDPIETAEQIIAGVPNPPQIQHGGSKAFYSRVLKNTK